MEIVSASNPQVKEVVSLREHRERQRTGHFLIEGFRELSRAVQGGVPCERLFICPSLFLGTNESALIEQIQQAGSRVIVCAEAPFRRMSYRDRPDGLLAVAKVMRKELKALPLTDNPLYVIAESIEKPGNLGTILRSSDATGVTGMIVVDGCTDIFNPNVVRASVGTLFTVPVVEATLQEVLNWLRAQNIRLAAATPRATTLYSEACLTGPLAIAFGTEQLGLSEELLQAADLHVRLPMKGVADSLNVAMSTTVMLYEVLRQRCGSSM